MATENSSGESDAGAELAAAIEARDVGRALAAIQDGAGVDEPIGRNRNRPLGLAIASDHAPMLFALLIQGADPSLKSGMVEAPPIVLAAGRRDPAMARALIAAGADVDASDACGVTALHQAARLGSAALVDELLSAGGSAAVVDQHSETPLGLAVEACFSHGREGERCVSLLAQPTLAAMPRLASHALKLAVALDSEPAIAALAAAGVDLEDPAGGSLSPLAKAASSGRARAAKALLDFGALPADPATGWSAAAVAARSQGHEAIADMIEARALAMRERAALARRLPKGSGAGSAAPASKIRM